jgi:hypothetical protein
MQLAHLLHMFMDGRRLLCEILIDGLLWADLIDYLETRR